MSKVIDLTDSSFEDEVKDGVVVVDFWASWCGPCKMMHPILDAVSGKVLEGVKVTRVNVDDCPDTAGRFSVQSIPTILVLKAGEEVARKVGVTDEKALLDLVENA